MAYTKQSVNDLLSKVLEDIDISDEMFDKARTEYQALGNWIGEQVTGTVKKILQCYRNIAQNF